MKKTLATAMAVGAVVTLASNASAAAITSSAHDFNLTGWYSLDAAQTPYTDQICVPCHAPHGNQNLVNELLWNHDTTTVAAFTPYSSPTMDGVSVPNSAPTLQCMACHDGTVALEAFPQNLAGGPTFIATGLQVGFQGNFAQDHPIGVSYGAGDLELQQQVSHTVTQPLTHILSAVMLSVQPAMTRITRVLQVLRPCLLKETQLLHYVSSVI